MHYTIHLTFSRADSVDGPLPSSTSADNRLSKVSESQLLAKGAACDLLYLGGVKVDKLTGDGAVQYAMNKVTSLASTLKTTIVNIKVNQEGITLTDNNRRYVIIISFKLKKINNIFDIKKFSFAFDLRHTQTTLFHKFSFFFFYRLFTFHILKFV